MTRRLELSRSGAFGRTEVGGLPHRGSDYVTAELPKRYDPADIERALYDSWESQGHFVADPESDKPAYPIVLPPPNVTGSLHVGHALTAAVQDTLIRFKRMTGHEALWLPGSDHAGIATQMVVERDLAR